ncbi:hypothetical protein D3OALGB2SA_5291 [Olavius algarvensis associated proteobacterium Delta 3]|nr:hypothetical protein D3OALGB2SA_5291 [Olavius algarvensis associated proteobacterium Delta 3]
MWMVDAVERCRVIGIGIGIDVEVSHSVSIPIPSMSIYGLPRNGIRLTNTHYVQTEHIYGEDYRRCFESHTCLH